MSEEKPPRAQEKPAHKQEQPETGWQKTKRIAGKTWHFLWHEDSLASWVANIILAFILIKFIVYPVLGSMLGTSFPIVAVVSGSMEHDGTFGDWWARQCSYADGSTATQGRIYERLNITEERFSGFGFRNGFNKGDLMILYSPKDAAIGDVLVYQAPGFGDPIIHRIIATGTAFDGSPVFATKGDANCGQSPFERGIGGERVLGKAVLRLPLLGWIKIGFVNAVTLVKCSITRDDPVCVAWWNGWK